MDIHDGRVKDPEQLRRVVPLIILFGLIFSLISVVNHFFFRTYALDLGIFNQALYAIVHLKKAVFTLGLEGYEISIWGTHFSPILFFYIPFQLIFGSYGLLIVQILVILSGGLGIYRYSYLILNKPSWSMLVMIIFFGIWGIYSALAFDFHNNVVGAMMVPWFFYFLKKENIKASILFYFLIIITQESVALWMIFILAGLIIRDLVQGSHKIIPQIFRLQISLLVFSTAYFLIVTLYIVPHFNQQTDFFFRYAPLGDSFPGIVASIITDPWPAIRLFFSGSSLPGVPPGIKLEFHLMVLLSGGVLLLYRPHYLIMLIPLYAQKMLSTDPVLWGINMQYSIEFVPVLALCIADSAGSRKLSEKHTLVILIIILILVYAATGRTMIKRNSIWYNKTNTVFWQKPHYEPDLDIRESRDVMRMIPDGVPVSASSPLAPHLYKRDKLYHFPVVKDADYIMILKGKGGIYPLDAIRLEKAIDSLKNKSDFSTLKESDQLILFKRE